MNQDKTTDDVSRPVAGPVQRQVRPLVERLRTGVYGLDRIALCAEAADEIERLRMLLTRIDVSISGCSANAVTSRDWAHDMDAVQQMLRDELRA